MCCLYVSLDSSVNAVQFKKYYAIEVNALCSLSLHSICFSVLFLRFFVIFIPFCFILLVFYSMPCVHACIQFTSISHRLCSKIFIFPPMKEELKNAIPSIPFSVVFSVLFFSISFFRNLSDETIANKLKSYRFSHATF